MIGRLDEVVVDCIDPATRTVFWQRLVGDEVVRQSTDRVAAVGRHRRPSASSAFLNPRR
jgi:hypothetical protein